jgi:biotin carboxyl carrier protein
MQYDISVPGHSFKVSSGDQNLIVNDQAVESKITKISENEWSVLIGNRCLSVVRSEEDETGKTFVVNGTTVQLDVKTELDLILDKLGMDTDQDSIVNEVNAPMPGAILEVSVEAGQEVQEGDKLIVLEAMKMENIIKSPTAGIVSSVSVSVGDNVEKGQSLITF